MRSKHLVPAVVGVLFLAVVGLAPVVAAVGDVFAVGKDSNGDDLFRVKNTGAVVYNGPVVQKRLGTSGNAILSTSNSLVGVTSTTVARGIYLPDAASCDIGHTIIVVDESGGAQANNILVYGAGSDTVNGGAYKTLGQNYGSLRLYKGQAGKWFTY